jgi:hypothetical protein
VVMADTAEEELEAATKIWSSCSTNYLPKNRHSDRNKNKDKKNTKHKMDRIYRDNLEIVMSDNIQTNQTMSQFTK